MNFCGSIVWLIHLNVQPLCRFFVITDSRNIVKYFINLPTRSPSSRNPGLLQFLGNIQELSRIIFSFDHLQKDKLNFFME